MSVMSVQQAVVRRGLHDEIAELLRNMIVEGALKPGERIPEQKLCDHFRVSRTPLREALKVLSAENLVRLLPNKGASVVRMSGAEVEEIVIVLAALEALAGELACARIDRQGIVRIRRMHKQMIEHYRHNEEQRYNELDRAIHEAIFEVANNQVLTGAFNMLQARLRSLRFVTPKAPTEWAALVEDHERMMAALQAKDGGQFAIIARRHMGHTAELIRKALDAPKARSDAKFN